MALQRESGTVYNDEECYGTAWEPGGLWCCCCCDMLKSDDKESEKLEEHFLIMADKGLVI
jgi:hypothetical protein